jgi:hypothetical protein
VSIDADPARQRQRDLFGQVARELAALPHTGSGRPRSIGIVVPVFNDWAAFRRLVEAIDTVCETSDLDAEIIVVDDGSWRSGDAVLREVVLAARRIRIVPAVLVTNLGHQRAIAVGLVLANERASSYRAVVVMDGDGEDRPEHLPLLLRESAAHPEAVICVRRGRRFEGVRFMLGYAAFKAVFSVSTGMTINFGHYCVIPTAMLDRLVHSPALWSHFAAALLRSGLPLHRVRLDRGTRYAGRSSMSLTSLIRHGLNAIAVFEDVCLVRLLVGLAIFSAGILAALAGVLAVRFGTDLAVPGWATSAAGLLLVVLLQAGLLAVISAASHLNRRSLPEVVPARDAGRFLKAAPPMPAQPGTAAFAATG